MGCCGSLMKYLVFICNFLFFLTGCVITGFGAYMHIKMKSYFDFVDGTYLNSAIVLIIVGLLIALISFFGCCGACSNNSCMMYTFGVFMAIVLIAEIGVVITIAVFKDDAVEAISTGLKQALQNYDPSDQEHRGVTETWNALQHDLHCCGIGGSADWKNTPFGRNGDLPDSCCKIETEGCGTGAGGKSPSDFYSSGCLDLFVKLVEDNSLAALGGAVGVILIQLATVIVSCCLARRMSDERNMTV